MAQLQKAIAQLMEGRAEQRPTPPDGGDGDATTGAAPGASPPAIEAVSVAEFAEALYGAEGPPTADTDAIARAASALAFVRERTAPVKLRVFTPEHSRDGWSSPLTVIETALADRAFIVDTLRELLQGDGGEIRLLLHPILGVERDASGRLQRIAAADEGLPLESFVHVEVANLAPSPALQQRIAARLDDVLAVNDDYAAMRARLVDTAAGLRAAPLPEPWDVEREESAAFLDWLSSKSFVFLGYREYSVQHDGALHATARASHGLGLLRDPSSSRWISGADVPPAIAARIDGAPLVLMSKTNATSPVHRPDAMDDIAIKEIDADGAVVGVRRLLGLFTFRAEGEAASEIPILRQRLAAILARQGVVAGSHDARNLTDLFNSVPREELLTSRVEDVLATMRAVVAAESALHVDLCCHADTAGRGVFVNVLLPRARYSTELGERITAAVARHLDGPILLDHLALDDRIVARLHYHVAVEPLPLPSAAIAALREELGGLLRTWDDALADALAALVPRAQHAELVARYRAAFPAAYRAGTEIPAAARDVSCIEALRASGEAQIELARAAPGMPPTLNLYASNETLVLSEFVPVLEHLGLRVLGEDVITLTMPAGARVSIHRFGVEAAAGVALDADRDGPRLVAALHAVRAHRTISDPLNALVVSAGLDWQAVAVLRAYASRASQTGDGAMLTIIETLNANPACAQGLVELFAARFDPNASAQPPRDRLLGPVATAEVVLRDRIAAVPALIHDRVLRSLCAAMSATVRTNAYALAPGAPIALKLDLTELPPASAPASIEVWVDGVGLRGVHLRAGRVARGGIRFSDRPDDFRAEVMGLLRTQVVKNAVIVPVGAKGGFVIADAARGIIDPPRVEAAYRAFIDALLSITDNRRSRRPQGAGRRRRLRSARSLPCRRRGQGHGRVLGRRQCARGRPRLLARRRLRLGGQPGIRPQGARHHGARRVGVCAPALPRARARPRSRRGARGRDRRHERRRVRQWAAALTPCAAGRRFRPPPHLPRSAARRRARLSRTAATVYAPALDLGGLCAGGARHRRRRLPPRREVDPAVAGGAGDARAGRSRAGGRDDRSRDPPPACRPAVERRHRHLREGERRDASRGRRSEQRRGAHRRARVARDRRRRGR